VPVAEQNLLFALRNVARHGDTDVFPFPLENHWFHDAEADVAALLERLDQSFDDWLGAYPVTFVKSLSNVGFNGFRAATQIDPLWNAYLVALVLEIAPDLEAARLAPDRGLVFSYRFLPSAERYTLFDPASGWGQFHRAALDRASAFEYIVSTDISDFYARVYHHRLENALMQATRKADVVKHVMELLQRLSGGTSYGLPVGGHAARLLAEVLLNRTDRLLRSAHVDFCRFVDDYLLFAGSLEVAQTALVQLSEILLSNEGLTLSRAKTRIMSRSEFVRLSPLADPAAAESEDEATARQFLGPHRG
jgi:Mor family transcriptional regulator